jgi:glycine cleavage system regulatory protein
MKVTPIPEVKIRHDEENAGNLFGRTGYYQPDTQEIVLYVTNRHPKDVLRSFCHELIHHMQNLEGRDLTFYTTDVHADENLKAIEQEAHAKGSFLFRDWENSNKEQTHINEAAILESLTTPEKEDLVRQVLRLTKIHGDNIEKIANRLSMPKSLGNKIGGVGKSFGKRFVEAVLKEIAVNRIGTYYPEDTSDISLVLERLKKLYKEDEGESTEERI